MWGCDMTVRESPHLGVTEPLGAARKRLPSREAVSPGRAHLQTGAAASSAGSRSAAALWTADTAQPWAPGAGGGQRVRRALFPPGSPLPTAFARTVVGRRSARSWEKAAPFRGCPPKRRAQRTQPRPRAGLVEWLPNLDCLCFPEKTGPCHLQSVDSHRASAGQERGQRQTRFQRSSALVHLGSMNLPGGLLSHFPDGASEAQSYHLVRTRQNWKSPER